jgi:hypothetical protein
MDIPRRTVLLLAGAVASVVALSPSAIAQIYPARPITIVVPFPPRGPTDVIARILAERMKATLSQPLIVENVPGAAGSLGVGRVARAAPDGYTIVVGHWQTHVLNAVASSGDLLPSSPTRQKATTCQDQARKACTDHGTRDRWDQSRGERQRLGLRGIKGVDSLTRSHSRIDASWMKAR